MSQQEKSSIESWTLMALVYRDLDDGDYQNALFLSERLYAMNKENTHYKYLYANCLYHCLDYTASYTILKGVKSIPCLNLFAKSCLELGNLEEVYEKQRTLWEDGVQALLVALSLNELPKEVYWGDELASATVRHHMPSKASLCNLLGDLYLKLDNIKAAATYYWDCLKSNPYKISAYTKLCDVALDSVDFNVTKLSQDIFVDFDPSTTDLSTSPNSYLPARPSSEVSDISFSSELKPSEVQKSTSSMPDIIEDYHDITVNQLRALVKYAPKILETDDPLNIEYERGDIEKRKSLIIDSINNDIKQMKASEAYKNKHGLHKKPPVQIPQKLKVDLTHIDENEHVERSNVENQKIYESIQKNIPPRITTKRFPTNDSNQTNKRFKSTSGGKIPKSTISAVKSQSIETYFLPQSNTKTQYQSQETDEYIIQGMNKVMKVLCIIASGYLHQSFYYCEKAALELQKLDDNQYNSARVLCILGKAYYHASDFNSARAFFKQAFVISPWYCEGVPLYSTCLWYLEKEKELNLLAFMMKDNRSHLFEAYIAAGNWTKCSKGGNEATQWFQKAVKLDPAQSYGHTLLGYEEWEKGNSLGAKQYFAQSMITNKRSYMGWYGMANAYMGMEEYHQARVLLAEAVRLHPRHPILLSTTAEVLYELEHYKEALEFVEASISIRANSVNEKLKEKILYKLNLVEEGAHNSSVLQ